MCSCPFLRKTFFNETWSQQLVPRQSNFIFLSICNFQLAEVIFFTYLELKPAYISFSLIKKYCKYQIPKILHCSTRVRLWACARHSVSIQHCVHSVVFVSEKSQWKILVCKTHGIYSGLHFTTFIKISHLTEDGPDARIWYFSGSSVLKLKFLNYNSAPTSFEFGFMLGNGNFMLAKMFVFDVKTRSVSKLLYSSIFANFQLGVNFFEQKCSNTIHYTFHYNTAETVWTLILTAKRNIDMVNK